MARRKSSSRGSQGQKAGGTKQPASRTKQTKTLTAADLEQLCDKLDDFGSGLDQEEQALLGGMLGLAGSTIQRRTGGVLPGDVNVEFESGRVPKLAEAFGRAFRPGGVGRLPGDTGPEIMPSVSVGVGVSISPGGPGVSVSVSFPI